MKKLFSVFCVLIFTNCAFSELKQPKDLGNFGLISKSKTPPPMDSAAEVVKGEHCRYANLYAGTHPQLSLAIEDALSKSPGSKGIKNVKVKLYYASGFSTVGILIPILIVVGFPMSETCYIVEGNPSK